MTFLDQWIERGRPEEALYGACDCPRDFGVYGGLCQPYCASLVASQPSDGTDADTIEAEIFDERHGLLGPR